MITSTFITGSVYLFYTLDTTDVNMRCQFGRKWFLKSCRAKYNIHRERDIVLEMYVILLCVMYTLSGQVKDLLYTTIDRTLVNPLHRLLNCEIGG